MFAPVLRAPWRRWFLDRSAEFWLGELRATWSLRELRARVVEVIDETPDTKTFVLAPNHRWPGHTAGQYVPVEVELDGVRVRRCYSISSGGSRPGARRIAITVRRVPGGRVSPWLHAHLAPGALVRLGAPAGDFTLAAPVPAKLLFVAGGSGITPVMAIVRDLVEHGTVTDAIVIHAARSDRDAIFRRRLAALAATVHGLRLVEHRGPRLDAAALRALVPDLADRETYACGPSGLLDMVATAVPAERLHVERFTAAPAARARPAHAPASVHLVQLRDRAVSLPGAAPLLDELEGAGLRPPHGCRIGICHTCRCRKRSGTVEDLATGALSSEPDQDIRLCQSIARSDLDLALDLAL